MRRDMFEVIIERPRLRFRDAVRKGRRKETTERAFERAPKQRGMGREGKTKCLNENLAPLWRFLAKHVGKPYNHVQSEMRAVLSMSSAVQKHVIDHVRDMVEEHPVMIDGVPHSSHAWNGQYWPLTRRRRPAFYVCPKTGLLRLADPGPRRPPPKE